MRSQVNPGLHCEWSLLSTLKPLAKYRPLLFQELLKCCEARNDVRGLERASARARALGLADEADAAIRRTRSRVEEARAAVTSAAAGGSREEFERAREWAVSAGVAQAEVSVPPLSS